MEKMFLFVCFVFSLSNVKSYIWLIILDQTQSGCFYAHTQYYISEVLKCNL